MNDKLWKNSLMNYSDGMVQSLSRLFDVFAIISVVAVVLSLVRLSQFGFAYTIMVASLLLLCVLPAVFMRGTSKIKLRGILVVSGFLIALFVGVINLGLTATALVGFSMIFGVQSGITGRRATYITMAIGLLILVLIAYGFVSGWLSPPAMSLTEWSLDSKNWFVTIFSILFVSILLVELIQNFRTHWEDASTETDLRLEQLEALVATAPEAIVLFEVDTGLCRKANARAEDLLGLTDDKLARDGQFKDLFPTQQPDGSDSVAVAKAMAELALQGQCPLFELNTLSSMGIEFPCEISMARFPSNDSQIVRASFLDITARKKNELRQKKLSDQLAASQRLEAIGKLTGGIAHDFNNLLAVTLGNLELLKDEVTDGDHRELVQNSIDSTLRGAELTRNMLSFARKAPLEPTILDLNALVRNMKNWIGRTIPSNIEVETSLLAGLWETEVDASSAEAGLLNLILNARDAMPNGGKLTIETSNIRFDEDYIELRGEDVEPGRYVLLAISDTGEGISSENLKHVFEPFFTTKPVGSGSGMGLSMIEGFMKQSKGTVRVYSEPGVGTTFKLYFKASGNAKANERKPQTPLLDVNAAGSPTILLVEDNLDVLAAIQTTLVKLGYHVLQATSGDEAFEVFTGEMGIDLLLTDIVMPGELQGTTLAKALRELRPDLPVVFMSGYATEATVHGNGLRPEDSRLMKPARREDLIRAINKALSKPSKHQK